MARTGLSGILTSFALLVLGCSGGEVDIGSNLRAGIDARHAMVIGNACVSSDEYVSGYSGYELDQINLETESAACSSGICLAYHFQGRVSCPYGQTEADLSLPTDDPHRCRVPRAPGSTEIRAVEVPVPPSFADRSAHDAAYCTCACDGPNPACTCPNGYSCRQVIEPFISGYEIPSVCVKDSTPDVPPPPQIPCALGSAPGEPGYCGYGGYNP